MTKNLTSLALYMLFCSSMSGQHLGMTFQECEKKGMSIPQLDSLYKSAVNVDSSKAVFKSEAEQEAMGDAYIKLVKDFGKFLSTNNFKWDKPTRCFNRIYFNSDGTIDYFLYNFLGKAEDKLSEERLNTFNDLLNRFIQDYKLGMTADVKFVQCSPVNYLPKE